MLEVILISSKILFAYFLITITPILLKKYFSKRNIILIPTSRAQYTLSEIIGSLLLFSIVIILIGGGTSNVGIKYTLNTFDIGLLAAAFLVLFVSSFVLFLPSEGKAQAEALGLQTLWDYVIHSTFYAFIWAGFREELLYRGFIQTQSQNLLGPSWGIIVSIIIFSIIHGYNSNNFKVAIIWVISTLPSGFILTLSYYFSDSIISPIIAHGINNAVVGILTYIYVFKSNLRVYIILLIGSIASFYIIWHWEQVQEISKLTSNLFIGLSASFEESMFLIALLLIGIFIINKYTVRKWLFEN